MATEFTLRQARYLVAAVETGSMAEAGRRLHVSASAVSQAVTALEEVTGAPLLLRVPHRPLTLTPAGSAIVGDLRRLIHTADDVVANARTVAEQTAGRLRIGCFRTFAPTYVPPLVAAVADAYPAIELEIEELSLVDLQEALLDGRLELGLLYDLDIRPDIEISSLAPTRPHILLPGEHRFARRRSLPLAALADEPYIMLDVPPSRHYFGSLLAEAGIDPPIAHTTGSLETLRSLVARGQGWSMLIQRPAITVSYEGLPLQIVAIADRLDPMPVVAAWPAGARLTRRARAVLELCRHLLGDEAHS
ncbi:MAG: LysR family transcriptional regulator [Actinomycetota bacterium]